MRKLTMLCLLLLLATGCQPAASPAVATTQPATETLTRVPRPKAIATEQEYPKRFETAEPSSTPTAIAKPGTLVSGMLTFELPVWVKDAASPVVLFEYGNTSSIPSEIGFFNPASGEQAIIRLPYAISYYYWQDANHILFFQGYCGEPLVQVSELDLAQGSLSPVTAENVPDYVAYCYDLEVPSKTIKINTDSAEPTVEILDPASNTWLMVSDPTDGVSDLTYELSPDKDYLGIVQIQGKYTFPQLWQPLFGDQVSVYHLPDRKLVATFAEGKSILAELLFTDNQNLVYIRERTPCVISISALTKKCIHAIPERFPGNTIIFGDPMPVASKFNFVYFGFSPHQGGWCINDLYSGEINCPTDGYADLEGQTIIGHALSPDGNFLLVEYDRDGCPPPWCDYAAGPQIAVIDLAAKKFIKLGDAATYQAMDIFGSSKPWRPAP